MLGEGVTQEPGAVFNEAHEHRSSKVQGLDGVHGT